MEQDQVRVLRLVEYTGDRDVVEKIVKASIHGMRQVRGCVIKAATIDAFPEILDNTPYCENAPWVK